MKKLAIATLSLWMMGSAQAWAQPAPNDPVFEEGRTLLNAGKFAEACAKFKTTWDIKPTPGKAFNLSVCEEKQGHFVRAARWVTDGMTMLDTNDNRRPGAIDRRDALEKRAARLTVVLGDPSLANAEVLVDGVKTDVGVRTPTDPGKHQVVARLQGHEDGKLDVEVVEGEAKQVTVTPGPLAIASSRAPVVAPVPSTPALAKGSDGDPASGRNQRIAGASLMGLGGASLVGFGVLAGLVASKHSAFVAAPKGSDRANSLASEGKGLEVGEAVLLAVGIAAAGSGLAVFATAPSAPKPTHASWLVPTLEIDARGGVGGIVGNF